MDLNLTKRTALVTGGAKRLGRETALALAGAGARVAISYRNSETEAQELVDEIKALGVDCWALKADLTVQSDLDGLIDRVLDAAGSLDILINNSSVFPASDFATFTLDELINSIKIDAWAPLALGRHFARKVGKGHIVNMLDSRYLGYDWFHVAYHASKYLLGLFTREMAIKFAPDIAVNAIAPGLILPPEGKGADYLESLKDRVPLKRIGDPKYIADAILYLVTSEYITGQVLYIDGGRSLNEVSIG